MAAIIDLRGYPHIPIDGQLLVDGMTARWRPDVHSPWRDVMHGEPLDDIAEADDGTD